MATPEEITVDSLHEWLVSGDCVLIDVREEFEHAAERIAGAESRPLSRFDSEAVRAQHGGRRIVFQCRTGKRSFDAACRYCGANGGEAYNLAGGIEAWKRAGHETTRAARAPRIDVLRQVQMTAGSLVLIGVLLGAFVSPNYLIISGFVGAGLFVTGATGWCGMAKLLSLMPWNRIVT